MDEFIEELVKSKGYTIEMKNALLEIIPAMISYYGSEYEMLICEAITSSYIYQCEKSETIYDVVKKYDFTVNNENSIVNEGDFKRADGVHISTPSIIYENGNYSINGITNIVAISNSADLTTEFGKSTLIHELGHLIKAYNNTFTIEGDVIVSRSGFIQTASKLSISDDDKVVMTTISDKNVGIEEGINSYDEANILSIVTGKERKYKAYALESTISERLIESTGLRSELVSSQLTGNTSLFIDKYNEGVNKDLFNELSITMDESVKASYESLSNIFLYMSDKEEDKQKLEEINNRRKTLAIKAIDNIREHNINQNNIGKQV